LNAISKQVKDTNRLLYSFVPQDYKQNNISEEVSGRMSHKCRPK